MNVASQLSAYREYVIAQLEMIQTNQKKLNQLKAEDNDNSGLLMRSIVSIPVIGYHIGAMFQLLGALPMRTLQQREVSDAINSALNDCEILSEWYQNLSKQIDLCCNFSAPKFTFEEELKLECFGLLDHEKKEIKGFVNTAFKYKKDSLIQSAAAKDPDSEMLVNKDFYSARVGVFNGNVETINRYLPVDDNKNNIQLGKIYCQKMFLNASDAEQIIHLNNINDALGEFNSHIKILMLYLCKEKNKLEKFESDPGKINSIMNQMFARECKSLKISAAEPLPTCLTAKYDRNS